MGGKTSRSIEKYKRIGKDLDEDYFTQPFHELTFFFAITFLQHFEINQFLKLEAILNHVLEVQGTAKNGQKFNKSLRTFIAMFLVITSE